MSTRGRLEDYWTAVRRRGLWPPILTVLLVAACVAVFYIGGEGADTGPWALALMYIPGPGQAWYRSFSALVSHVSEGHLWINTVMLIAVGTLFEVTEGPLHTACIIWGAGNLSLAFHGVFHPNVVVRGSSGAVYGIMFAQANAWQACGRRVAAYVAGVSQRVAGVWQVCGSVCGKVWQRVAEEN